MADEGADDDLEFTLFNKRDSLVYQIPPASSSSGHKADDWKKCIWRGACRIVGKGKDLSIKMIDSSSGKLFAQCQIPNGEHMKYVEAVTDSSRYFVLKITNGDRHAFIGLGFEDRNDAFDFKISLSDFKGSSGGQEDKKTPALQGLSKDLSLGEGTKIKLNLKNIVPGAKKREPQAQGGLAPPPAGGGGFGILAPPPPGGQSRSQPTAGYAAPKATPAPAPAPSFNAFAAAPAPAAAAAADDFFADFDDFQSAAPTTGGAAGFGFQSAPAPAAAAPAADFGAFDFQSALAPSAAAPAASSTSLTAAFSGISFDAAPAAAPVPPPVAAPVSAPVATPAPAAAPKADLDPFDMAFGDAAASLSLSAPAPKGPAAPAPKKGGDPFGDLDIFK